MQFTLILVDDYFICFNIADSNKVSQKTPMCFKCALKDYLLVQL